MEDDQSYRLEEYRALRKEVELYLTESRSQERYTLIAVGAIWAWLILNHFQTSLLWSIPIILTAATSLRMAAILRHFDYMGKYIRALECKFGVTGWEQQSRGWTLGAAYIVLDVALLVLAIVAWCNRVGLAGVPCPVCPKTP